MNSVNETPVLAVRQLEIGYGEPIASGLELNIEAGGITALIGTNGSGKSTLLKTMARLLESRQGIIYLDGKQITSISTQSVARKLAVLPQSPEVPSGMTVRELVEQGRYPHAGPFKMLRKQDHSAIDEALEWTGMTHYEHRELDTLSGGERQRAWIALALAQSTPILMLDEPTTFLDIRHQLEILELIRRLNREKRMTIVTVLHDLNHAAKYADRMLVLHQGKLAADGSPKHVLTEQLLKDVFGIRARIFSDPVEGTPLFVPIALADDYE